MTSGKTVAILISVVLAVGLTALYLEQMADRVAAVSGYAIALLLPVLASLLLGAGISLVLTTTVRIAPVILSAAASGAVIGWALFAMARVH